MTELELKWLVEMNILNIFDIFLMHYIEKYQLLVTNENPEYKFVSYRRDKLQIQPIYSDVLLPSGQLCELHKWGERTSLPWKDDDGQKTEGEETETGGAIRFSSGKASHLFPRLAL